ncbi:hypothetical protein A3A45_03305 [Candidatus Daviesbacteria bacterium RIFCSPLOWO2_01_FULL_36_8]|nr:MAG: hypothetical protein A3A45_03305 [Candidatus Daviesbacteria bacterium RIFCSPLOWO2_01_FULL_36_8]
MPVLFQLAEQDSSRAGRIGMEIGSVRERIIIALLMYRFGEENVITNLPITLPETDVILFKKPISIKTVTGSLVGIKLIWTVDAHKAVEFSQNYNPSMDMLLVQINWNVVGWFYYIPLNSQLKIFNQIGRKNYIKLPKAGTNPRGVEITKQAIQLIVKDKEVYKIDIKWDRVENNTSIYDRWIKLWGN